ncbi:MAG: TIGR03084 family metal-binding protein [Acidimicrobiales bacterium]|jgi:uncharacterized protein (TIGR03084 family)
MVTLTELLADLDAEYDDLRAVVEDLADDAPEWDLITPAEGWAVRDQISHLAFFDEAGRLAMVDPEAFAQLVDEVVVAAGDPMDVHLVPGRAMGGDELLEWWGTAHRAMVEAFSVADPKTRVPWFGPPMGALSFISARLMETWAHGQDVCDALGAERVATARLFHIAHLGVRARPFSYAVRDRAVPTGRIHVAVTGPDGDAWVWEIGEDEDGEPIGTVTGTALDFCLAVTQRRNIADTDLVVTGPLAEDWMSIAQAFAGPPGPGRPRT